MIKAGRYTQVCGHTCMSAGRWNKESCHHPSLAWLHVIVAQIKGVQTVSSLIQSKIFVLQMAAMDLKPIPSPSDLYSRVLKYLFDQIMQGGYKDGGKKGL